MRVRTVYLALCVVSAIACYWYLLPWVAVHGPDVPRVLNLMFANPISAATSLDVISTWAVLAVFVVVEARRTRVRHAWAPLVFGVLVGVSFGLALFLYLREARLDRSIASDLGFDRR